MRLSPLLRVAVLAALGGLGSAGPALADAVTHWNGIAQAAIAAGRPGPQGALDSALVQAAVYDAVQSIERKFRPYKVAIDDASGSPAAAAAAAAHGVLAALYPARAATVEPCTPGTCLDKALIDYLSANNLVGDPGIGVGQQVAAAMMAFYRAAPSPLPAAFRGCENDADGCQTGEWRPTPNHIGTPPPAPAPMTTPWLGAIVPFTLNSPDQFRAAEPPALTSPQYLRDYNEVKALGSFANAPCLNCGRFDGLTRTSDQTALAYFWSENFLAQWNRALRGIAEARVPQIADSARLFALANLATADALITAWESKRHYNFWRPVTAVQQADDPAEGNPDTHGDAGWQSLINTPPYPDYTSGANNVTAAMTRSLRLFFGTDHLEFTVTSLAPQLGAPDDSRRTRRFTRCSQAADEVVDARIFLGIHFRFADTAARTQGQHVARWVYKHFLRPVEEEEEEDDR